MNEPVIVILAGGRGERFWPLSRQKFPKQLLPLRDGKSLLQASVERVRGLVSDHHLLVVVNQDYNQAVHQQLSMLPPENLIIEPASRNTAPAIGLAALLLKERFPDDPVVIFLPSDLWIEQPEAYRRFLGTIIDYCTAFDQPVIAGTIPTRPDTGFGYIHAGRKISAIDGFDYREILGFKEKPDLELAEAYRKSGNYLWNSGVIAWRLSVLLANYQTNLPVLYEELHHYVTALSGNNLSGLEHLYGRLPEVSFDEGILEPSADQSVVFIGDYTWSDLGSWNAWAEFWTDDGCGNRIQGRHFGIDTEECIIYSPHKPVATLGISNLVIVETEDVLMVCDRRQAHDLKKLMNRLKDADASSIL